MAGDMNRNSRCHCGSGKKFKNCHGVSNEPMTVGKSRISMRLVLAAVVVIAVLVFIAIQNKNNSSGPPGSGPGPAGKVWSEEHGHWH